jgi:hypothetical protein
MPALAVPAKFGKLLKRNGGGFHVDSTANSWDSILYIKPV